VSPHLGLGWLISAAPEDVTVLSGAGISVEGPSSLPTGWELTERIFTAYFPPSTLDAVLHAHLDIGWTMTPPCPDDHRAPTRGRPGWRRRLTSTT
jgi:hypothetical protein